MNKTPEEILNECATIDGQTIQEFCLKAMLQYGKQQYNQGVLDATNIADALRPDYSTFICDSIRRLIKQ